VKVHNFEGKGKKREGEKEGKAEKDKKREREKEKRRKGEKEKKYFVKHAVLKLCVTSWLKPPLLQNNNFTRE